MGEGVSFKQVSQVLGQALSKKAAPIAVTKEAIGIGRTTSNDLFGYDFVGLAIKLIVYFGIAFVFAKFMEAVLFLRGGWVQFAQLIGINIPSSEQVPESLKKLFNDGISGFKFWDLIKIIAIFLVIAEFLRYVNSNRKAGSSSSPMTIGIFILIISVLAVTSIPELYNRVKKTDFNLESLK